MIDELGDLPIKVVNGATIYIRDVAHVHDGNAPQTNIVHVDGGRSVLMSVLKNGTTSTLAIVDGISAKLDADQADAAGQPKVVPINDQSLFVRAAISGVALEGIIAAALTSLMILLFLGSWRSTVIIAMSIPLSILGSIIGSGGARRDAQPHDARRPGAGGRHPGRRRHGDDREHQLAPRAGQGRRDRHHGRCAQIVTPAFVSLLCICIVFVPMFFLRRRGALPVRADGRGGDVRDGVLVRAVAHAGADDVEVPAAPARAAYRHARHPRRRCRPRAIRWCGSSAASRSASSACATATARCCAWRSSGAGAFVAGFLAVVCALRSLLVPFLGSNFFPAVDGGQILMHARVPVGTRVEETAARFADIEEAIRRVIPAGEITTLVDNIGLPPSSINLTYNNTGVIGTQDGDIQIALRKDHRADAPTTCASCARCCRASSRTRLLVPAGRHRQPDPQLRRAGADRPAGPRQRPRREFRLREQAAQGRSARIPGVADARIQQSNRSPVFERRRRPHARAGAGAHRARRHQQPGRQPRRQQPGGADLTG